MRILTASAGSGKTYTLSHTYIDYLLKAGDARAYRQLLAVTFTNKATAEMKERILRDLKDLADSDRPEAPKAKQCLVNLLHDYGAFGVSTIDSFFQKTLRVFARELGQYAAYQIELRKQNLVNETIDRMLDGLDESSPDLLDWLKHNVMAQLRDNGWFRLEKDLPEMCNSLRGEEYRRLIGQCSFDEKTALSKERLGSLRKMCGDIIKSYEKDARERGLDSNGKFTYPGVRKMADPEVAAFIEERYCDYRTAKLIISNFYSLGLAREFNAEFEALLKEKNTMPLDESNGLLKAIIDGSDVPFVYEKTGSRYYHFLLDEFQDTSRLQWDNFLPLLHEAEASSPDNLIVGDVKQSIYRWRDSDWKLLMEDAPREFPQKKPDNLNENWRSTKTVVDFNNAFFEYAARELGLDDKIYSSVSQVVKTKDPQSGCVRVTYTDDQIQAVVDSIRDACSRGAGLGDIAVLVRKNKYGAAVAEALRAEGINFISDDSLDLKSSVTVRRLMSLLSFYDNPDDTVGGYLAKELRVQYPERYHSLVDFCEGLARGLREYDPKVFDAEALFVSAFMDLLQDWVSVNGNKLKAFIDDWNDDVDKNGNKKGKYIGTPAVSDAVRIMTIHKAKGLEFPHVIVPFSEDATFSGTDEKWCRLNGAGQALGHKADGIYRVSLSSSCLHSGFESAYLEEAQLRKIDSLNVFYVALTRASKSLHVIARSIGGTKRTALAKKNTKDAKSCSDLLFAHIGGFDDMCFGTPYDFTLMDRKAGSGAATLHSVYESIPLGDRLRASQDASDYFGEDGHTGAEASGRLRGIELHAVLSSVNFASDLPSGLDPAAAALLRERIEAHPEWFSGAAGGNSAATRARNELSIFGPDGSLHRPDRVVYAPDGGVTVIDYKFGSERNSYLRQVRRYMDLYREMGYPSVRGYVWYVPSDKLVEVQ